MAKPRRYLDLGKELRTLREDAHLSQAQLGAELGMSHATPSHLEGGQVRPHPETLRKIVRVLNAHGVAAEYNALAALAGYAEDIGDNLVRTPTPEQATVLQRLAHYPAEYLVRLERMARAAFIEGYDPDTGRTERHGRRRGGRTASADGDLADQA